MPVHDRSMHRASSSAHEYIVMSPRSTASTWSLDASTTGHSGVKWYGPAPNAVVVRCQVRVRSKAAADNTVTITPTINGTAITGAALAVPGTAAPNLVEALPTGANILLKDDILSFNTGAFGGTTPNFRDVQVVFVVRTGGPDIQPGTDFTG